MLFASRLPVTLDFILPRRAGWALFALAFEAFSRPGPRGGFTVAVSLALAGSIARFGFLALAAARSRRWSAREAFACALACVLTLLLTRWSFAVWFEISQKVWFPLGSMNVVEPAANAAVCSAILLAAMSSALRLLADSKRLVRTLLPWTAVNAAAAALAMAAYGAWRPSGPLAGLDAAGTRRTYVVLTEEAGRPNRIAYDLPATEEGEALTAAEKAAARPGVRRLEILRALYEARAKLMDPEGLRRALLMGVERGDDLARAVLLEHLSSAPPSPECLAAIETLADQTAHRIGPVGAARIALAYAHLGDTARAALWAERGSKNARGIPAGLLDLAGGGALKPGRISGRVNGLTPLKVGLYRKTDPGAPYLLDAAGLVASVEPGAKGRFSFSGLPAGRYYLAFAFRASAARGGEIRVSGGRGDLRLDPRAADLDVPALTFSR